MAKRKNKVYSAEQLLKMYVGKRVSAPLYSDNTKWVMGVVTNCHVRADGYAILHIHKDGEVYDCRQNKALLL